MPKKVIVTLITSNPETLIELIGLGSRPLRINDTVITGEIISVQASLPKKANKEKK